MATGTRKKREGSLETKATFRTNFKTHTMAVLKMEKRTMQRKAIASRGQ
jgi:hypothetical protein